MADSPSRYASSEVLTTRRRDGQVVSYLAPRLSPIGSTLPLQGRIDRLPLDRIDRLANRAFGDPQQFWRLCDANDVLDPLAYGSAGPGRVDVPRATPGE